MRTTRRAVSGALGCIGLAMLHPFAVAQPAYPNRTIHLVNPYAPGGVVDILARALASRLGPALGTPMVVEARPGGGSTIGTDHVASAPADGYTWLIATTGNAANMALMPNIRTDLLKEFAPVAQFAYTPNYFVVPASSPASTLQEYVALARKNPGKLNYGSGGIGSTPFLGFELFKHVAGIDVVAVHYKGSPPQIPDLVSGQLSAAYLSAALTMTQARSGRLKVLAIADDKRSRDLPDVPTFAEAGYGAAAISPWFAVLVRSATPQSVRERIEAEIRAAVAAPELVATLEAQGAQPEFLGSTALRTKIENEIAAWRSLVRATGIKAE
jgi:tripartite-type tricarboxylate transporter receptor subunit TctC